MNPPISPGDVVAGRYVVGRVIGSGGAGIVYAAEHRALRKRVVLKFLRHESTPDSELVQRFVREARAAAQLRSEHVAHVMDAEIIEPSVAFIAMEYLEGRDLAQLIEQDGPQPIEDAVDMILQASEAIAEAHARGIIHRDIKPSNLFLTRGPDGSRLIKVLDFGLSKVVRSNMSLTSENSVIGSPHFMSPEQMRSSRDTDLRTDIWALGAVLFTLLAGVCPFPGRFLTEVCAAVLSGASVPLREVRPEVSEGLEAVIMKCLVLDPQDRFQTVPDLAAALEPYAPAHGADRVARVRRIAEAVDSMPASEAPLTVLRHVSGIPSAVASESPPASVFTAAPPDRHSKSTRRVLARILVLGIAVVGAMSVSFVLLRSSVRGSATRTVAADARPSVTPATDPAPSASPAVEVEHRPPSIAGAPNRDTASPAVFPRVRHSAASLSKASAAGESTPRPSSPAPRPRSSPVSDEDRILSLPH